MKIRFTEKLLWDIYKLIKNKDELMDSLWSERWHGFKDPLEIIWPDFYGIKDVYWKQYKEKKKRERFVKLISHLKNNGYLNIKDTKNRKSIMLTPKGVKRALRIEIAQGKIRRRKDKKWQMILFDIPEQKRRERDLLRKQLKYLGYKQLQKSIWACPYDVLKPTQQLIKNYKLDRFIRLLLVEEVLI